MLEHVFKLLAEHVVFALEDKFVVDLISSNLVVHEGLHIVVVDFSLNKPGQVDFLALDFVAYLLSKLGELFGQITLTII